MKIERDLRIAAGSLALLLLAWFPRLLPGAFSADDYALLHGNISDTTGMELTQGRFLQAGAHLLLVALGADPVRSFTLLSALGLVLLAASCAALARAWRLTGSIALPILLAPLLFAHPTFAELCSFRLGLWFAALAIVCVFFALMLARTPGARARQVLGAAALLVVSAATYQTALNLGTVAILFGIGLDLARAPGGSERREALRSWLPALAAYALALPAYYAVQKGFLLYNHFGQSARGMLLAPAGLRLRLSQASLLLRQLLFWPNELQTNAQRWLQLGLLGLGALLASVHLARRGGLAFIPVLLLSIALALVAIGGVMLPLEIWYPTARTLTASGTFWAGAVALVWVASPPRARFLPFVLGSALALGYLGIQHRAADEGVRGNARELAEARQILERFAGLPGTRPDRYSIIGHPYYALDDGLHAGDLNLSAFNIAWGRGPLLVEVSHGPVGNATPADDERGAAFCKTAPHWPAPGSWTMEGDLGIVCF